MEIIQDSINFMFSLLSTCFFFLLAFYVKNCLCSNVEIYSVSPGLRDAPVLFCFVLFLSKLLVISFED